MELKKEPMWHSLVSSRFVNPFMLLIYQKTTMSVLNHLRKVLLMRYVTVTHFSRLKIAILFERFHETVSTLYQFVDPRSCKSNRTFSFFIY